jgi:hypothetical protein
MSRQDRYRESQLQMSRIDARWAIWYARRAIEHYDKGDVTTAMADVRQAAEKEAASRRARRRANGEPPWKARAAVPGSVEREENIIEEAEGDG